MKLFFYKATSEYGHKYWTVLPDETTLCKDFHIPGNGIVWSVERNDKHEFGSHFELTYSDEHQDIMLYCQPDYDEVELIGIKFCPWCAEKIEFEVVKD